MRRGAADNHWALTDGVLAIGHRGAALVAPENTVAGIDAAREAGVRVVEVDVRRTADGHLVLLHDATVDRTTDGTGAIAELTLAEAQALDAGHAFTPDGGTWPYRGRGVEIPTLAEALAAGADLLWDVEIKQTDPPIADEVVEAIEAAGMQDRVFLACFDDATIRRVRSDHPDYPTNFGEDEYLRLAALTDDELSDYTPPGELAQVPERCLTPRLVEVARRVGVKVHVWTVNDPTAMATALDTGADGVITDDPAPLLQLMEERRLR